MRAALQWIHRDHERIDGIIHAAGDTSATSFVPLHKLRTEDCDTHFRPKIRALYVLEQLLADERCDFVVLLSSLSSLLGGIGFGAYAAANRFMDVFAHRQPTGTGPRWLSVNLDYWRAGDRTAKVDVGSSVSQYAMDAVEGMQAFSRIWSEDFGSQVAISTGDLNARVAQWLAPPQERPTTSPRVTSSQAPVPERDAVESIIASVWQEMLGLERIESHHNFFDLGGNSLIGLQLMAALNKRLGIALTTVMLFEAPTIARMAEAVRAGGHEVAPKLSLAQPSGDGPDGERSVAIIGMAGRFPGAHDVHAFWNNLATGTESVSFFTDDELIASGANRSLLNQPGYVKARPMLVDADQFDARFFGYSPRDAEITDPQQRLFLECAWQAIGTPGYDPDRFPLPIGVFGGTSASSYCDGHTARSADCRVHQPVSGGGHQRQGCADHPGLVQIESHRSERCGSDDCSTSLVAVHLACQSLINGECGMALAGGVSVRVPQKSAICFSQADRIRRTDTCAPSTGGRGNRLRRRRGRRGAQAARGCHQRRRRDLRGHQGTAINNDGTSKSASRRRA